MQENYKAWQIDIDDFYKLKEANDRLRFLIRFAVLAPSSHNTQPWEFFIKDNNIYVLPALKRRLAVSDSNERQLFISLGCAIENILTAARCYGYASDPVHFPNKYIDGVAAAIKLQENQEAKAGDLSLLTAIINRVTNRGEYKKDLPPPDFINKFQDFAGDKIAVHYLTGADKNSAADAAVSASVEAMEDRGFRRELSRYVKNNLTRAKLGIPCFGLGIPTPISLFVPFLIKYINLNKISRKKDEKLLKEQTPAIIVLSSKTDTKEDWLQVGQLYEKISLEADKISLTTAMWAAPIQIGEFYKDLQKILNTEMRPQALFRIGYPTKEIRHSPRLSLDMVMKKYEPRKSKPN